MQNVDIINSYIQEDRPKTDLPHADTPVDLNTVNLNPVDPSPVTPPVIPLVVNDPVPDPVPLVTEHPFVSNRIIALGILIVGVGIGLKFYK